ncbi:gonadotropin-releasing hormone II receptor-like [Tiliqua scincoides]|uniref:gonadotropin-releasing hormone II receptor-like n=1 Tax=Tiliqua scincoides TaxID=71010 RepID=UPI0034621F1E
MRAPEANGSAAGAPAPWESAWAWGGAVPANGSRAEGAPVLPTFSAAAQARVALTLVLSLVAGGGNAAVLWAGTRSRRARRSQARVLLLHLAGADLLVALLVMPLDAAWNITLQWRAGDVACRLLMFLKLLAMYASAFVTAVISLDRQAAILQPLAIARAGRRNQVLLQAAWLLSAGLSAPQLFLFHTVTVGSPQSFTQCSTQGSFAQPWHETAYNMFTFLGLFLLPLLVMVACYSRILWEISHSTGSSSSAPLRRSRNPIPQARLRMLCLSVVIVGSFVVCWTPYYLLGLWYWFWPAAMEGSVPSSLAHLLFVFGLVNACLDPITYGLFTLPLHRRLGCCCGAWRPRTQPQPLSLNTSSFPCSAASSIRVKRGVSQPDLPAETTSSPAVPLSSWPQDPGGSHCL